MKALRSYLGSMYPVTGFLLLLLAAVASIGRGFPVNLVVAAATAAVLDAAIKKIMLKRKFVFIVKGRLSLFGICEKTEAAVKNFMGD